MITGFFNKPTDNKQEKHNNFERHKKNIKKKHNKKKLFNKNLNGFSVTDCKRVKITKKKNI